MEIDDRRWLFKFHFKRFGILYNPNELYNFMKEIKGEKMQVRGLEDEAMKRRIMNDVLFQKVGKVLGCGGKKQ